MKKTYMLAPILAIVFMLNGVGTASAFCTVGGESEHPKYDTQPDCDEMENELTDGQWYLVKGGWLVDGSEITTPIAIQTNGTVTLTDLDTLLGEVTVECEGSFDGTVDPEGHGEITEALSSAGEKISSTPLSGLALLCTSLKGCEGTSEVWPVGLPWKTQLAGLGTSEVSNRFTSSSSVGYEVSCSILGIKVSDECKQATESASIENMGEGEASDLLELVNDENGAECSLSKTKSGDISGHGLTSDVEGSTLTVSGTVE